MKIAFATDYHIGIRNAKRYFLDRQIEYFKNFFWPTLLEHDVKYIFNPADYFDDRSQVHQYNLSAFEVEYVKKLKEYDIIEIGGIGNHDCKYTTNINPNWVDKLLSRYDNFIYCDDFRVFDIDSIPIIMVPWICHSNKKDIMKKIKNFKEKEIAYLVGHFAIKEFVSDENDTEDEYSQRLKDFEGYKQVICGHIHTEAKKGNVWTIGNPYDMTVGDISNLPKSIKIFDTKTQKFECIASPYNIHEFIDYDDRKDMLSYLKGIDSQNGKEYEFDPFLRYNNKIVIINVINIDNDGKTFDRFQKKLYEFSPHEIRTHFVYSKKGNEKNNFYMNINTEGKFVIDDIRDIRTFDKLLLNCFDNSLISLNETEKQKFLRFASSMYNEFVEQEK